MGPAVIAGSAVQVNVMVNSIFASWLGDGPISWLSYAFRLMQLPLGIFGVAIATVTLPVISKLAVIGENTAFRKTLAQAIRLAVFLTVPAAMGLILLAQPIISLIYERGKFSSWDTQHTAAALQFYAIGLIGYSCTKILSPAFYAIDRKWTPMLVSFIAMGLNLFLNWLLIFYFQLNYKGLALSTALCACFNFAILYNIMRRHTQGLETRKFFSSFIRTLIAAIGMAGICGLLLHCINDWLYASHLLVRVISLIAVIFLSIVSYLGICTLLQLEETRSTIALISKKLLTRFSKKFKTNN